MTNTKMTPSEGTSTHPHLAAIIMEPAMWARFERAFEDRPEVKVLTVDRRTPDAWTVYAACNSREVQDLLEANW
jgi:hypothetical protein